MDYEHSTRSVKGKSKHRKYWVITLAIGIIWAGLTWLHYTFIVEVINYSVKDFATFWVGGKAILSGLNPYDVSIWTSLPAQYGTSIPNQQALYPLWTFFFTVPFSLFPISLSSAIWLSLAEILLFLTMFWIIISIGQLRPSLLDTALLGIGGFASISTILVLVNGQISFLILAILALFLLFQKQQRPFLAGFFLAFIIIKPNPFILFIPTIGLWLIQQQKWKTILGSAIGSLTLLSTSWIVQHGWISEWLNARSRTEVTMITPTLWGLAAEISADWWLPIGLIFVISLTSWLGWYIFTNTNLSDISVTSLALIGSLLVTPYIWVYEFVLLFIPWLWLYTRIANRKLAQASWLLLAFIIPWLVFIISTVRIRDTLGFLVPLLTGVVILWLEKSEQKKPQISDF